LPASSAAPQFAAGLRSAREKIADATQEEIDTLCGQVQAIVRLALLMKERRLETEDALDAALHDFNTSLDEQIKSYGEYMLGVEAARPMSRLSRDKKEAQQRLLETLRSRIPVWTIYDND